MQRTAESPALKLYEIPVPNAACAVAETAAEYKPYGG
jgi:hypothetical protein